jgi:hypothetical protein
MDILHMGGTAPTFQGINLPLSVTLRSVVLSSDILSRCGVGNKADRRPIDPPPIVELRIRNRLDAIRQGQGDGQSSSPASSFDSPPPSFQPSPYFFMFAALVAPQTEHEMHLLKDGKTRTTVGSVVSSLYTLKDPDKGCETGFFVFPDLSVRTEGSYRLKLSLFEVVGYVSPFWRTGRTD